MPDKTICCAAQFFKGTIGPVLQHKFKSTRITKALHRGKLKKKSTGTFYFTYFLIKHPGISFEIFYWPSFFMVFQPDKPCSIM